MILRRTQQGKSVVIGGAVALLAATCVVLAPSRQAIGAEFPSAESVRASIDTVGDPLINPLTPARILDTRTGVGGPIAAFAPGEIREFSVVGVGGIDPAASVGAVVLNVTATAPTSASFVTVWPSGSPRPTTSNLNFSAGQTVPNLVIIKVGTAGKVSLYNDRGQVHLIADVVGWFPTTAAFTSMVPQRIMDTRNGVGSVRASLGRAESRDLFVSGAGGVPTSDVGAVVLNVTATNPTAASFLTVWPAGETRPNASNLNFTTGQTVPNLVIAKVGAAGRVSLYNDRGSVDVIADVVGWFPASSSYGALTPERMMDTRTGIGTYPAALLPGETRNLHITGHGGVPATGAGAVVLNITAVDPTNTSFVTVWPAGETRPNASSLNLRPGAVTPNLVIAKLGASGDVSLYNDSGATHLLADVVGWFPLASNQTDPTRTVVLPESQSRVLQAPATADDNTLIFVPRSAGFDFGVGDVVVVEGNSETSAGDSLGLVLTSERSSAGTVLRLAPGTLADLLPNANFLATIFNGAPGALSAHSAQSASVDATVADFLAAGAQRVAITSGERAAGAGEQSAAAVLPGKAVSLQCTGSAGAKFTTTATITVPDLMFGARWTNRGGSELVELKASPQIQFTAAVDVGANARCTVAGGTAKVTLPTARFTVGFVPLELTQSVWIDGTFTASGSAAYTATVTMSAGVRLGARLTGLTDLQLSTEPFITASAQGGATLEGSFEAYIPLVYEAAMYRKIGLTGRLGPFVRGLGNRTSSPNIAIDAGVRAKSSAFMKLTFANKQADQRRDVAEADSLVRRLVSLALPPIPPTTTSTATTTTTTTTTLPQPVCSPFIVYAQNRWYPSGASLRAAPDHNSARLGSFVGNTPILVNGWTLGSTQYPTNPVPFNNNVWYRVADGSGWVSFPFVRAAQTTYEPDSTDGGPPVPTVGVCRV